VRAYIECHYGFHDCAAYSLDGGFSFDETYVGRSAPMYICGYMWGDFALAKGDVSTLCPISDNDNISTGDCVVVTTHKLPRWAPRFLPQTMFDYICEQLGGRKTKRAEKWKASYWPLGWKGPLRRKHFSSLSEEQKESMEDAFLDTNEALFDPSCPPSADVEAILHHRLIEEQPEEEKNAGIPVTLRQHRKKAREAVIRKKEAEEIIENARKRIKCIKEERKKKKKVPKNPFLKLFGDTTSSSDDETL